jgi:hypothetical protein
MQPSTNQRVASRRRCHAAASLWTDTAPADYPSFMSKDRALSTVTTPTAAILVAVAICACSSREDGPGAPAQPPPLVQQVSPPVTPPGTPQTTAVYGPGGGLGGSQVQVDGRPVWPPQGPGCDQLVACCRDGTAIDSAIGLSCQLSMATDGATCPGALQSVRAMIAELGRPLPASCQGPPPSP